VKVNHSISSRITNDAYSVRLCYEMLTYTGSERRYGEMLKQNVHDWNLAVDVNWHWYRKLDMVGNGNNCSTSPYFQFLITCKTL